MNKEKEIERYHLFLNSPDFIDLKYYRRNKVVYELVSYINTIVACYLSENYEVMTTFLCRAKRFLKVKKTNNLSIKYIKIVYEYLELIQSFIFDLNNDELKNKIKTYPGL